MSLYNSDHSFSLWGFNISHQILLLRCNGCDGEEYENIDIIFLGVFFLNIPTCITGLDIYKLSAEYYYKFNLNEVKKHDNDIFFVLKSEEKECLIGALAFSVYHNKLDRKTSSIKEGAHAPGIFVTTS